MKKWPGVDSKKFALIISIIVLSVSLFIPMILRSSSNNSYVPLEESFHIMHVVASSFDEHAEAKTPFIALLKVWTMAASPMVMQIIFAILSILFLWLLLRKETDTTELGILLGLVVISPMFIISHMSITPYAFITCLSLCALWLLRTRLWALGILLFVIVSLQHFSIAIVSLLVFIFLSVPTLTPLTKKIAIATIGLAGVIAFVRDFVGATWDLIPQAKTTIIEFGSFIGFPLLLIILSAIGFIISWDREKKKQHIFALIVILLSNFYFPLLLLGNFLICVYATKSIVKILHTKWDIQVLKVLSIVFLLIIGLATYSLFIERLLDTPPTQKQIHSLQALKQNTETDAVIWSHSKNSYLIEAIANRTSYMSLAPSKAITEFFDNISKETGLVAAINKFSEKNISYLYIDAEMTSGLVWSTTDEGLLLVLNNRRAFFKLYDEQGTQIYRINYENVESELQKDSTT